MPELHDYQKIGSKWLASRKHALLADEMGLGKSAQAITAADDVNAKTIVIICRAVARRNWKNEILKFSKKRKPIYVVGDQVLPSPDVEEFYIVTSYESVHHVLHWLRGRMLGGSPRLDLAIVDESHFVKSPSAERSLRVFGMTGLLRLTERMWCLTGTPTPNHAAELWLMFYVFGITKLPHSDFVRRFCTVRQSGFGEQITGTKREMRGEFQALFDRCALQRSLSDSGVDLPALRIEDVIVQPGPVDFDAAFPENTQEARDQLELTYKEMVETVTNGAFIDETILEILKASTPAIATLRRYLGLQKFEPVVNLLSGELQFDPSLKLVIFCVHVRLIEQIAEALKLFGVVQVTGSNPERGQVDRFQNDPATQVFIGQIQAANTSVNLTAAHEVVIVEPAWTPADNAQSIARCLRLGQTRSVRARFIRLDDPVDASISDLIRRKTESLKHLYEREKHD